ncbi:MAG: NUDIX domain-containing protein [Candidatus Pacearchaeota archaeon]
MVKVSAGLLMFSFKDNKLYVFLVHNGGPFFKNKDNGFWSIPKGEVDNPNEDLFNVAKREMIEETSIIPPENISEYIFLGKIKQKNNKIVYAWAFKGVFDVKFNCNSYFEIEVYGKRQRFPEIDIGRYFEINEAKLKINSVQLEFINRLIEILKQKGDM